MAFVLDQYYYTLCGAWSRVNWADLMTAQGAFGIDFYDRSTRTIVGTMPLTEYRPVLKIGPKGALGSHEIRPIHSAPTLGQSIFIQDRTAHKINVNESVHCLHYAYRLQSKRLLCFD